MANVEHPAPKDLTNPWPDEPSVDAAGEVARRFVVNLRAAMDGRSPRSVAAGAGLDEGSVRRVVAGTAVLHLRAAQETRAA